MFCLFETMKKFCKRIIRIIMTLPCLRRRILRPISSVVKNDCSKDLFDMFKMNKEQG